MVEQQGSDLHLKAGVQPIIRKKGKLFLMDKEIPSLSNDQIREMIEPIMSSDFKKLFLKNKNVDFGYYFPQLGRFRFCVFSQKGTLRVVIRAIKSKIPTLSDLNLPSHLEQLTDYKNGMILITGASGSGKSTSAACLLDLINRKHSYHILTIEDPIEYVIHDYQSCISQRELYLDYMNKKDALKSALRQDPDVIFFGEIRDRETMEAAIQASESGHLVISTLHSSTAIDTIDRCLSFFDESKQNNVRRNFINNLRAIISQRLILSTQEQLIPAVEFFLNTIRMKQAFIDQKPHEHIFEMIEDSAKTWGMQTFDQTLIAFYLEGLISKKMALQSATYPENVRIYIDGMNPNPEFYKTVVDNINQTKIFKTIREKQGDKTLIEKNLKDWKIKKSS